VAEFSARRIVAIAAIAGALVGGAVAGGVAAVAGSGSNGTTSSTGGSGSVTTAAVVRTTLTNAVQVGGSIGYGGSYTIAIPSGTSAQQIAQDQQAVTQDQQALAADEQAASDASGADGQAVAAAQSNVNTDQSTLQNDQAKLSADQQSEAQDCAGDASANPSSGCSQDQANVAADQKAVSQDQAQLSQAKQQLDGTQSTAARDRDQNQAKVSSDQTKLHGDQATLATAQASATNSGTTYTSLPHVGDTIKEDEPVYALDNEPVPLLYGAIPAYRAFNLGMSDGADVDELTQDLIALGYGAGLSQSNHYSSATAAAVERWQRALGLPVTGKVLLGQVVFEPGAIRVTSVSASVGQSVGGGGGGGSGSGGGGGGGTVLTATSTTPIVTVNLDVSQDYLVKPGDAVSIVLPTGTSTVTGHIETVGNVATCPGGGGVGTGTSAGGGSGGESPCSSAASNNSSPPTVTVTITMDSTPAGATLDQAPVNVNINTQSAENVLAVPVNALLALQGGGFGVEVVSGNTSRLVGVTTGLYANNLVQVSGSGISAGMRVEVPSL
jgi:hypothetical protein